MKTFLLGSLWSSIVFAAGCMPAASPLDTFKVLVDRKVEEIKKAYPSLPMNDVAVDVKKTDSLASPYVGEMTFLTVNRGFSDEGYVAESEAAMRLQYALQDGEWAFKGGEMSESNWRVVRDTSDKFGAQVVASLNKRTHGSAGIATEELLDSVLKEFNKNLERKK